jgi:integrase
MPKQNKILEKGIYVDGSDGKIKIRVRVGSKLLRKTIGEYKTLENKVNDRNVRRARAMLAEWRNDIECDRFAQQPWTLIKKLERSKKRKLFREAADEYMETRSHKPSTVAQYDNMLKHYILPEFGDRPLTQISAVDVRRFQKKLQEVVVGAKTSNPHKMSATRVNLIMQVLRSILKDEHMAGTIESNPSLPVRRIEEAKTEIHPLSEDELNLVLRNIDDHFRPLFTALAYTGARPNELLALRWTDVDMVKKQIRIERGRVRGNEGTPKTMSSKRTIPMFEQVEAALLEMKARPLQSKDNYVFFDKKGQPINKHLDRVWTRALKRCGLAHRSSYQLRHTFCTLCIIHGQPLPYIAKLLGHTTIDTLVRHYAGWIDTATPQHEAQLRETFSALNSRQWTAEVSQKISSPPEMPLLRKPRAHKQ